MTKTISILLFIVGVINFIPIVGILSAEKLSQTYGINVVGNDLIILLRHRALLFGILGGFILYSVFVPYYQPVAMVMGLISMLGYLYFAWAVGDYNASLYKVAIVDLVGLLCLIAAGILKFISDKNL